ncbi:MAG: hydratase [Bacteroides sp.]|nr:hydratase [Prevotella sp.]MCM1407497.1 hydratase [Treponema brennaborense]MCM1469987.1 hydratase [Bacteroides sp.]
MIKLWETGAYLENGKLSDPSLSAGISAEEAAKNTMSYRILQSHNTSEEDNKLKIKFDKITSHDITYVSIIQTARASGLEHFPLPYILTNCHNSLCAVGGTINEDDHCFGLTCAQKYGGIFVPPHLAVIHQYAREMIACCGEMILGSDSHTRYGALGTMAVGEGGGELVKQLLGKTYDIARPDIVAVYLTGEINPGVGPQDVALAIIKAVFSNGYVKNKVMEFVGPGIRNLSADFRIGIDVMTTETTCLSSIWETDETIRAFYAAHGRECDYRQMSPQGTAYYDGAVEVNLSDIHPMIAMPFHPSNVYEIDELNKNLYDILGDIEEKAKISIGDAVPYRLRNKIIDGGLYVDQGIIAGCAGGGFENICAAADILKNADLGSGSFSLSVYPASLPVYLELVRNGATAALLETGTVMKTAFCGPCFGAGDTPANNAFSIRHSTRNFPNREGSKLQNGQIASVALMDARSIAATAANMGRLTSAEKYADRLTAHAYHFDSGIYARRVYNGYTSPHPNVKIHFGPNIKDWPEMPALADDILLKIVSEIHDPVTTTDELIPSGETSSYRSNPIGLAEFTLSRKDPEYTSRAKAVRDRAPDVEKERSLVCSEIDKQLPDFAGRAACAGFGSAIYAKKPGDGSAREQAASCQKVLGGMANIAGEYATKRYRSNLINWGMIPFVYTPAKSKHSKENDSALPFSNGDYIFIPDIKRAIAENAEKITAYCLKVKRGRVSGILKTFELSAGTLTEDERNIIQAGCLINYYRN